MKRFFAAPLLLFTLLVGCANLNDSNGDLLPASERVEQAYWSFNALPHGTTLQGDLGMGTLTHTFVSPADFLGTTVNAMDGVPAGRDFGVPARASLANNGRSFTMTTSTRGYEDIRLSYATRRSPEGFTQQEVCYAVTEGSFPPSQCVTVNPVTEQWVREYVNLPGATNQEQVWVRVTLTGATNASGNNRFDNIAIRGTEIQTPVAQLPEPPTGPFPPSRGIIEGFFRPVDMTADTYNVVRAGSTVPLKFRVFDRAGDEITDPSGIELITYTLGTCNVVTDEHILAPEPVLGGTGAIRYSDGQFIANWATPRRTNFCYVVRAQAPDGATTQAFFRSR